MPKAISSYRVILCTYEKNNNVYTFKKLIDIKDFPDMGGSPEMLDCTTTSDPIQTFIPGIQMLDNAGLEFTANFTRDDYARLCAASNGTGKYALVFDANSGDNTKIENGAIVKNNGEGAFVFDGKLTAYPKGGAVNSVVDLGISIAPSTAIEWVDSGDGSGGGTPTQGVIVLKAYKRIDTKSNPDVKKAIVVATSSGSPLYQVVASSQSDSDVLADFSGEGDTKVAKWNLASNIDKVWIKTKDGRVPSVSSLVVDNTPPTVIVNYPAEGPKTIDVMDSQSGIAKIGSTEYPDYPGKVEGYIIPDGATSIDVEDALGNKVTTTIQQEEQTNG